jgi:hypothetical protein
MANHLEQLISEWLEFKGYFVRRNVKVGKLRHGGYEGELDIVGYHPIDNHLIQVEPSIDAHTWKKREERFKKKFDAGRKYIIREIFPWLPHNKRFEQWAILWASDKNYSVIGGGKVIPIWKMYWIIARDIIAIGKLAGNAIPEQLPLLRTMQFTLHWASPEKLEQDVQEQSAGEGRS